MMVTNLELFIENYAHLLAALAILVLFGGFAAVLSQLKRNHDFQREMVAKTTYREYLKLCVAKPTLASAKVTKASLAWDEYTWFVSLLLRACDEVVTYAPRDRMWRANIKADLAHHRAYLGSAECESELALYSPQLRKLIAEVLAETPAEESKPTSMVRKVEPKIETPAETAKTEPAKA